MSARRVDEIDRFALYVENHHEFRHVKDHLSIPSTDPQFMSKYRSIFDQ